MNVGGQRNLPDLVENLFLRLPVVERVCVRPYWPKDDRGKWLKAAAAVFDLVYGDEPTPAQVAIVEPVDLPNPLPALAPAPPPPSPAGAVETLDDQIMDVLPALVEQFPKGPTVNDIAARLDCDPTFTRRSCLSLQRARRANYERRADSSSYHLTPVGYEAPRADLTELQAKVLTAIAAAANEDGLAMISRNDICEAAQCSKGGIDAVLTALSRKKYIAEIARGSGTIPNTIRVLACPESSAEHGSFT